MPTARFAHLLGCRRESDLLDQDHEWDFFKQASRSLYAPACGLAAKALAEHDGREFDELTAVRGLLTWLGLDCELDTRRALDNVIDEPDMVRDNLVGVAYLIPAITQCSEDAFALEKWGLRPVADARGTGGVRLARRVP